MNVFFARLYDGLGLVLTPSFVHTFFDFGRLVSTPSFRLPLAQARFMLMISLQPMVPLFLILGDWWPPF